VGELSALPAATWDLALLLLSEIRIMPSRAFIQRERMRHARAGPGGFTLIEAMVASGIMALFVTACFTAITFDQVAVRKSNRFRPFVK
jgi:prepilin-type N-terminal cleavage/methylation domain-containing protein